MTSSTAAYSNKATKARSSHVQKLKKEPAKLEVSRKRTASGNINNAMGAPKSKRMGIDMKHTRHTFSGDNRGRLSSSSSSDSSRFSFSSRKSSSEDEMEQENLVEREVSTISELRKGRLSRHKLSLLVHAPFFDATVVGCYVRLGDGRIGGSEECMYRLWKIVGVEKTNKIYEFEGKKTNKNLKCQSGEVERLFRMQFVSNADFQPVEFDEWLQITRTHGCVPTVDDMDEKRIDIEKALSHMYTEEDVDLMIKEKSKFQQVPLNFAKTKATLVEQKKLALQRGDFRAAERLHTKVGEIERKADELDKQRSRSISVIGHINNRNRNLIMNEVLRGNLKMEENSQDDPFTRKKGGMRIVSGSKSRIDRTLSASMASTNFAEKENTPPVSKFIQLPSSIQRKNMDVCSLHDFDLDIDFSKLKYFSIMKHLL